MTVKIDNMTRIFKYDNRSLQDPPGPQRTPDEVREFYSRSYPELSQCLIHGPEYVGNKIVFTFSRSAGTKGTGDLVINQPVTLKRIAKKGFAGVIEKQLTIEEGRCLTSEECNNLHRILSKEGTPLLPKSFLLPMLP